MNACIRWRACAALILTVVQLHGTGPWGITYVNVADGPRKP